MHLETGLSRRCEALLKRSTSGSGDRRIRILIVDDTEIFKTALGRFLSAEPVFELVGVASNGLEAFGEVKKSNPDLVIMDVMMPVMGGVEATRVIKERFPEMIVIGLSSGDTDALRASMLKAGAAELFGKMEAVEKLIPAIHKHVAARNLREGKGCA